MRQPPPNTPIDWTNPITEDLLGAWIPNPQINGFFDATGKGNHLVAGGASNPPSIIASVKGYTYQSNSDATTGTSGNHRCFYLPGGATAQNELILSTHDAVTLIVIMRPENSAGTYGRILCQATEGGGIGGIEFAWTNLENRDRPEIYINSANFEPDLLSWPDGEFGVATLVAFPGQDVTEPLAQIYKDKSADLNTGTVENWTAATGVTPFVVGNWNRSDTTTSRHFQGQIYGVFLWKRELSQSERHLLVNNPYQIFKGQRMIMPVGPYVPGPPVFDINIVSDDNTVTSAENPWIITGSEMGDQ